MLVRIVRAAIVGTVVAGLLAGCQRIQPIYSVKDHPVPIAAQNQPLDSIELTIQSAAAAKGWRVDRVRPGLMRATQKWRDHTAIVDITYDQRSFSIDYEASSNLKAQGDQIHRAYNNFVKALEDEIDKRLYNMTS